MKISPDDYTIIFTPQKTKQGDFNGSVNIKILFHEDNIWDERTRYLMLEMATLVAATIPLLETDDDFLKLVRGVRTQLLEDGELAPIYDDKGNEVNDTPLVKEIKDNVIHVDWRHKNGKDWNRYG